MSGVDIYPNAYMPNGKAVVKRGGEVVWAGALKEIPDLKHGDNVLVSPDDYLALVARLG
jgi:hypothetical protein